MVSVARLHLRMIFFSVQIRAVDGLRSVPVFVFELSDLCNGGVCVMCHVCVLWVASVSLRRAYTWTR